MYVDVAHFHVVTSMLLEVSFLCFMYAFSNDVDDQRNQKKKIATETYVITCIKHKGEKRMNAVCSQTRLASNKKKKKIQLCKLELKSECARWECCAAAIKINRKRKLINKSFKNIKIIKKIGRSLSPFPFFFFLYLFLPRLWQTEVKQAISLNLSLAGLFLFVCQADYLHFCFWLIRGQGCGLCGNR